MTTTTTNTIATNTKSLLPLKQHEHQQLGLSCINEKNNIPVLPNELLVQVIGFTSQTDLAPYLFVSRFTYTLICPRVYRKVVFPDDESKISMTEIIQFCHKYGASLETIKLPQGRYYTDTFYSLLFTKFCPQLTFLQSSMTPKQVQKYRKPTMTFMLTPIRTTTTNTLSISIHNNNNTLYHNNHNNNHNNVNHNNDHEGILLGSDDGMEEGEDDILPLDCCSSCLIFPTMTNLRENGEEEDHSSTMMHISHYFHHPGALRNGILPTYGEELLSLTLNRYDVLTASVAKLIIAKCPRLRYLVAPAVKAEGLWMILRWCDTLVTVIVGLQADDQEDVFNDLENEKAVATIAHYKRVWCVHSHLDFADHSSWHIGIIPRK
ncbi:hypothetical protein BDA99DRAFT_527348 [Phascolomyces articulosus]|uniref:F-box domain-containing protein n=1 Tax=Phascolomyces articulosus TaxID=60185 RepID=A0AAD5JX17_9FUNG|nr:hypothetical protein BDA99DRAFT_527348 [Phascolomyces articulosus]